MTKFLKDIFFDLCFLRDVFFWLLQDYDVLIFILHLCIYVSVRKDSTLDAVLYSLLFLELLPLFCSIRVVEIMNKGSLSLNSLSFSQRKQSQTWTR